MRRSTCGPSTTPARCARCDTTSTRPSTSPPGTSTEAGTTERLAASTRTQDHRGDRERFIWVACGHKKTTLRSAACDQTGTAGGAGAHHPDVNRADRPSNAPLRSDTRADHPPENRRYTGDLGASRAPSVRSWERWEVCDRSWPASLLTPLRRGAGPTTIDQRKLLRLARIPARAELCAPAMSGRVVVPRSDRAVRSRSEYASRWPVGFGVVVAPARSPCP